MRNTKLLAWPMVLMLGLLMTGFAYAHWSQTIYIEGSVASGTVDWEFVGAGCWDTSGNDYHCRDGFAGSPPIFWMGDKDVGSTSCAITDPHTVTLTLTNVYPSYFTSVSVYAHNNGSIPLIFDNVIIDGVIIREDPAPVVRLDLDGDDNDDVEILWGDGFGEQRENCEWWPEMSFWIHVLQDAPENATLNFTIEIIAVNWNCAE